MLQLQIFWNELNAYLKSLDGAGRLIQITLLVIGAFNLIDFFFAFSFFNLFIAAVNFGLVYFGYMQYEKSLSEQKKSSDSSLEA